MIDDQLAGSAPSRMKFNDIRLIGPLLIVALIGALMISPSLGGGEGSVGGAMNCVDQDQEVATALSRAPVGAIAPCPTAVPTAAPTVVPTAAPTAVPVAPAATFPDTPRVPRDKVTGPTWLGPIVPTVVGDQVTLQFPELMTIFVGQKNEVRVRAPGGLTVYRGVLPSNGKITFTGVHTSYTVTTRLVTEADYCEIVPVEASDIVG